MSTRPNFFIVGAPKCGTTAMFAYLAAHPEVFAPRRKEPTHFAHDLDAHTPADSRYFTRDRADYLALFADWRGERHVGEASVWYLYSEVAAAKIKEFAPDARIIIMLRDPVEAAYSLHSQRLASGAENIESFEEALAAEAERAAGRGIPRNAFVVKGLLYRSVVRYADQVRRYLDTFGRDQVLVLLYEDFAVDPSGAYREVCKFLKIDTSFSPTFERVNANTIVRSRLLLNTLRLRPRLSRSETPGPLRRRLRRLQHWVLRANQRTVARPPLDPARRTSLEMELRPDVKDLSRLLEHDLVAFWDRGQDGL